MTLVSNMCKNIDFLGSGLLQKWRVRYRVYENMMYLSFHSKLRSYESSSKPKKFALENNHILVTTVTDFQLTIVNDSDIEADEDDKIDKHKNKKWLLHS